MTDNFKEIGSLFGREGAGAGFAKQTDKESFTYAFAWPEGDTWATLTGYLNLDEQPEEYVRRVLQDGGFRSDWGNPDYDPIGDFKETAGDEYRIPLLKVLLREQLASRYEVANTLSTYAKPKRPPIPMEFQTIPSTMSSMMTMTISQPFQSQKPSKLERKETI